MLTFRALGALVIALVLAFGPAQAADGLSRKTEQALEKATSLVENEDFQGAREVLSDRLDDKNLSNLDKSSLLFIRSQLYSIEGNYEAAELDIRAALSLDLPAWRMDELTLWLAFLLQDQDRNEEALAVLQDYSSTYGGGNDIMELIHKLELETGAIIPTDLADRPMKPTSTRAPQFPAECPRNAAEYRVSVLFDVTADGAPTNIRVVSSSNPCLEPAAIAAVSQWTFDPAVQSGYFVQTRDVPVTVTFS